MPLPIRLIVAKRHPTGKRRNRVGNRPTHGAPRPSWRLTMTTISWGVVVADKLYGRSAPVLVRLHVGLGSEIPRGASASNLGNYRHAVTASCAFEEDVDRALDAADCAGQRHSQDPGQCTGRQ